MSENTIQNAQNWLKPPFDSETIQKVKDLIENNPSHLEEVFHKDLSFGTGGMRGIMDVGTNRMNQYTIGRATQGLANYLKKNFKDNISVAIAHDVRNNSDLFTEITASVLSANGIKVFLFDDFRATPKLSFAVRELGCQAGIVITASHNPPEYNGYKVYWNDGAQVVPPHDKKIISEIYALGFKDVLFEKNEKLIEIIDSSLDNKFHQISTETIQTESEKNLSIVFTPIHGTSIKGIPEILMELGFKNVLIVESQAIPDGNFSTVKSPNPEETEAFTEALKLAQQSDAELIIGTDPDADRFGIAVKNHKNKFQLLTGNQANVVLLEYLLKNKSKEELQKSFIATTVVSSDLVLEISKKYNIQCESTLTGFKWIGEQIKLHEGSKKFIGGGEESYGFLVGDFVRDKDALTSAGLAAIVANEAKQENSSYFHKLLEIYLEHGVFEEKLVSLVKKGISGAEEIKELMVSFRENPPKEIDGEKVEFIEDFEASEKVNVLTGEKETINLPKSNVLIFRTEKGTKVAVRPSGTEPKIKFYLGVKSQLDRLENYDLVKKELEKKLSRIEKEFVG